MAEAPTIVPRGRVTEQQKLCLQQNAEFLKDEMDTDVLVSHLFAKLILDTRDMQNLSGITTQHQKNAMLLDIITMRTPRGFEVFLTALQATGHQNAYDRLTTTMSEISCAAPKKNQTPFHRNSRMNSDETDQPHYSSYSTQGPEGMIDHTDELEIMDILHKLAIGAKDARKSQDGEGEPLDNLQAAFNVVESRLNVVRQELKERVDWDARREEELSRLQQQLTEANQEIARLRDKDQVTSTQLAEAQLKNEELLATVAHLRSENEALHTRMGQLEDRVDMFYGNVGQMQQLGYGLPALRQLGAQGTGRPGARRFQGDTSKKPK